MMRYRVLLALTVSLCLLAGSQPAYAGWGLPNLNPFSSEKNDGGGGWRLPGLPGFGKSDRGRPSGGNGKSLLTKTKETLFPWTRKSPAPVKLTGTRRTYYPDSSFSTDRDDSGESFFSSWFFSADDEPNIPMAPHEWLAQPRLE